MFAKSRFWQRWASLPLNERKVKLLNRLLDGFDGKLTSSKWAGISKCSQDTALRDITQLLDLGVLRKTPGGGRSTGYGENPFPGADVKGKEAENRALRQKTRGFSC